MRRLDRPTSPNARWTLALATLLPLAAPAAGQLGAELGYEEESDPRKAVEGALAEEGDDEEEDEGPLSKKNLAGLKLRGIGPAVASGRVGDLAVDPEDPSTYYVAVCSGNVWKTTNAGTTFAPVFDGEGSYSIGCVALDPNDANVVWVGTGENNSQRSVGWGDGVYRSANGGQSWENVGLEESEHVGMIAIDPRDSDRVFVAAQGPLWRDGGDRGLYRTTDGGATWELVLEVDEHTGCNEVHLDPRDPDVMYASTYQRRRHVWTLIDGGPGSGIWKSTDGGDTWRELEKGLPEVDLGRIGMDVSPADPDVLYAVVEAARDEGGFFRSTDRGETWEKMSDRGTSSPQYYNEIFCDPAEVDRVYLIDTFLSVTEDGGKTFRRLSVEDKHVDDHVVWIDPADTEHLRVGCDGGVYETWDRGATWDWKQNLPVTQFYKVAVDQAEPFYNVYGGTQDNNTLGGPVRTISPAGIVNEDWFVTVGGDGFEPAVDPTDPNTVYSQWQNGGLIRHDRPSREVVDIRPMEGPGEPGLRWNWDAPLIVSPHSPTRLYYAANVLFRSEDRGNTWERVSGELSRDLDRNQLEVMGRIWSVDTVAKNRSTSYYGNAVALCESPLAEGLLYVGTDDGRVHVTEDGGATWRAIDSFEGVAELAYVSDLEPSPHDADTVYATFSDHKHGVFDPYVFVSRDRGRTWSPIASNLPEDHVVWAVVEDHVRPGLLFAGTEFGLFTSLDGGERWIELSGGLPTIGVRDVELQRREGDVVLATFGRGFYVLDDYAPLREMSAELLERDAHLFAARDAWQYVEGSRLRGRSGRGSQGSSYYSAPNPPYGAVFTYWLKDKLRSRAERRHEAEKELAEEGADTPYPSWDELRAEDLEPDPRVVLTIRDEDGAIVRTVEASRDAGLHRVAWDLRLPARTPVELDAGGELAPWEEPDVGPMALPGRYTATLDAYVDDELRNLGGPVSFGVKSLGLAGHAAPNRAEVLAFQRKVADLERAAYGAARVLGEAEDRVAHLKRAALAAPAADPAWLAEARRIELALAELRTRLSGDRTVSSRSEPTPPSILSRVGRIVGNQWRTTAAPTQTERDGYRIAGEEFRTVLDDLRGLVEGELAFLEETLESAGAPWTPSRLPRWTME